MINVCTPTAKLRNDSSGTAAYNFSNTPLRVDYTHIHTHTKHAISFRLQWYPPQSRKTHTPKHTVRIIVRSLPTQPPPPQNASLWPFIAADASFPHGFERLVCENDARSVKDEAFGREQGEGVLEGGGGGGCGGSSRWLAKGSKSRSRDKTWYVYKELSLTLGLHTSPTQFLLGWVCKSILVAAYLCMCYRVCAQDAQRLKSINTMCV